MRYETFYAHNADRVLPNCPCGATLARWALRVFFAGYIATTLYFHISALQPIDRIGLLMTPLAWLYVERITRLPRSTRVTARGLWSEPSGQLIPAQRIAGIAVEPGSDDCVGKLRVRLRTPMYGVGLGGAHAFGTDLTIPYKLCAKATASATKPEAARAP
ncbi:hypothetical protein [Jannaschia sp. M317]|uniref:hypothetical protein n=1 Tax=Jannaschia sp. M317 TaxID=2867011 RepID=UPI0021A4225E|nr:hypothetical protein [Jannaschia sp. M317]UWQ16348.1 hypothetical protein K3551_10455 [Jannaschia sp. M317]